MRILFFLGSGTSVKSDMPLTPRITEEVMDGEWHREANGLYYPGNPTNPLSSERVDTVRKFLRILNRQCAEHLSGYGIQTNYEHLFDLARKIQEECFGSRHDPAMGPLLRELSTMTRAAIDAPGWHLAGAHLENSTALLGSMSDEAMLLIQCVVKRLLDKPLTPRGLDSLLAVLRDSRVDGVDLVTLNHDLVIETFLHQNGLKYVDGFSLAEGDFIYFVPSDLEHSHRILLLKPHGSINWYRAPRMVSYVWEDRFAIIKNGRDPWHARLSTGDYAVPVAPDPIFLSGTDKVGRYFSGMFQTQVSALRRALDQTTRVICSGYGWKDDGMNHIISEWLWSGIQNRLIILHPNIRKLVDPPGTFLTDRYDKMNRDGRLEVVSAHLCDASPADILSAVFGHP